jgi:hypothetical protein
MIVEAAFRTRLVVRDNAEGAIMVEGGLLDASV